MKHNWQRDMAQRFLLGDRDSMMRVLGSRDTYATLQIRLGRRLFALKEARRLDRRRSKKALALLDARIEIMQGLLREATDSRVDCQEAYDDRQVLHAYQLAKHDYEDWIDRAAKWVRAIVQPGYAWHIFIEHVKINRRALRAGMQNRYCGGGLVQFLVRNR